MFIQQGPPETRRGPGRSVQRKVRKGSLEKHEQIQKEHRGYTNWGKCNNAVKNVTSPLAYVVAGACKVLWVPAVWLILFQSASIVKLTCLILSFRSWFCAFHSANSWEQVCFVCIFGWNGDGYSNPLVCLIPFILLHQLKGVPPKVPGPITSDERQVSNCDQERRIKAGTMSRTGEKEWRGRRNNENTTPESTGGPWQWHPVSKCKQFFLIYTEPKLTCLIYITGSELWGGHFMPYGVLLCNFVSRCPYTALAVCLGSLWKLKPLAN